MLRLVVFGCSVLVCGLGIARADPPPPPPAPPPTVNSVGDVLTRDERTSRLWRLDSSVQIIRQERVFRGDAGLSPWEPVFITRRGHGFPAFTFVQPVVYESASSIAYPEHAFMRAQLREAYRGERRLGPDTKPLRDVVVTNTPVMTRGDAHEVGTLELEILALSSPVLDVETEIRVRTWETRIDERAADAVEWPAGAWPEGVERYLEPEAFVSPDAQEIVDALEWCVGVDPELRHRPYAMAKRIAACLMDGVRIDYTRDRNVPVLWRRDHLTLESLIELQPHVAQREEGLSVRGSEWIARRGTGTEHDITMALCALFRAAGLPTRLVVGLDTERDITRGESALRLLRTWVEFALYDEVRGVVEWIPVDVARQIEFSSRPPALDTEWQYFGRHDGLDTTVPISLHVAIPGLRGGGTGLWGYRADEDLPDARRVLLFTAFPPPVRADDPPDPYAP